MAWNRLAQDLDRGKLAALTVKHPLSDVTSLGAQILAGQVKGRVVFEV